MATVQTRPFSRDYSGLVNQSVLALCVITICITSHEIMKRKRRGKCREEGLGSTETWEFGYLYQGRSWAKNPSPPHPRGWPLAWIKPVVQFPESKMNDLRGVDATLYCRFLRGCFWFTLLHTFTTTPILLPIHLHFSDDAYPSKSMDRALISSLLDTNEGLELLWIHLCLLAWVTVTWVYTLLWICSGAYRLRAASIEAAAKRANREAEQEYNPHPHPQHPFLAMPPLERDDVNRGLRLRTIMVTNVPQRLRSERELKEYFEYYMMRSVPKPAIGLTSTTQPGLVNRNVTYLLNRAKKLRRYVARSMNDMEESEAGQQSRGEPDVEANRPVIERVTVTRKMTELASLHDRREEVLRRLETAHIKLAQKALGAVKAALEHREKANSSRVGMASRLSLQSLKKRLSAVISSGVYADGNEHDDAHEAEDRMDLLTRTLGPYIDEFGMRESAPLPTLSRHKVYDGLSRLKPSSCFGGEPAPSEKTADKAPTTQSEKTASDSRPTVWDALFSLPRTALDAYQPLIHLSALFRGRTVPAIDYYTTKLGLLTALITENRSRAVVDYDAASTAFVTFADPDDARRACKYLAVHPNNPLACFVTMAPDYEDLDWVRLMKTTFKAEFVKDWVVDVGVWVFTIAWIIPVSLLVALVTIQNIATVIPGLLTFLNKHPYASEVISSLIPTLLTSGLMLLIPLVLLLIAKKAHTIRTLSALHDRIMTRYHKFLVANILVFFCVGVSALESFFTSFKTSLNVLEVVKSSFPTAGPFYVGWLIFTTSIHAGLELGLFGLPLIMYPSTKRQLTPRKRAVGIRPRTFNFYYWLPNHVLVVVITLAFAVLNPLLTPFALLYFTVESVVIKNQLIHVYAKVYEGNGHLILIRLVRYTLDGLILAQVVFLALVGVLNKKVLIGLTAVMIIFTVSTKLFFTRVCRAKFEEADILEARVVNGTAVQLQSPEASPGLSDGSAGHGSGIAASTGSSASRTTRFANFLARKLVKDFNFSYSTSPIRVHQATEYKPHPFGVDSPPHFSRLRSWEGNGRSHKEETVEVVTTAAARSMPQLGRAPSGLSLNSARYPSFSPHPLVTVHEKHPAWDDSARMDRPYDNPYYVRPVANHLWLPRNPVGLLDLDDTVNVFKAITSEPGAGQLGEWLEEGIIMSGIPSTISSSDQASVRTGAPRELDGSEDIVLPPAIVARVGRIGKEEDIDFADERRSYFGSRRPSTPRRPSTTQSQRQMSLRRPSTFSVRPGIGQVSVSASHATPVCASPTSLSPDEIHGRHRSASVGGQSPSTPNRPSLYANPRFASRSRLSTLAQTTSNTPLNAPSMMASLAVTTREALVGEVIEEEYRVTEDRMRQEEAEKPEAPQGQRSWMTSWMYSSNHHEPNV